MIIKVWNKEDNATIARNPTYTIEISNGDIDRIIKQFGEGFGKAFGEALIRVSEVKD